MAGALAAAQDFWGQGALTTCAPRRAARGRGPAPRGAHCPQGATALGAFFRRLRSRLGAPKAITATAHKLARLVYSLLKHGSASVKQGLEAYENQYRERTVKAMARHAKALGYTLVALGTPEVQRLDAIAAPTS